MANNLFLLDDLKEFEELKKSKEYGNLKNPENKFILKKKPDSRINPLQGFVFFSDYEKKLDKSRIEEDFFQWWKKKTNEKSFNGKNIKELFFVEGYPLFGFIEPLLYGNSVITSCEMFPSYLRIIEKKEVVRKIISEEKPKKIIFSQSLANAEIIPKICEKYKIKCKNIKLSKTKSVNSFHKNPSLFDAYINFRVFLRKFTSGFVKHRFGTDIVILTNDRFNPKRSDKDLFFGSIIDQLKKEKLKFNVVQFDRLHKNSFSSLFKCSDAKNTPIGKYYDKATLKRKKLLKKEIKQNLADIYTGGKLKELYQYDGIDIYDIMREELDFISKTMPNVISDILCLSESIITKEKPKIVVVNSEFDFYGKGLMAAARKKDVKSVALKFGEVVEEGFCDVTPNIDILPDYKCVDSQKTKDSLVKKFSYPKDRILIVGEPRYDALVRNDWNREGFFKELGLKSGLKTISIIDEGWRMRECQHKAIKVIAGLMKRQNDIQMIIKVHPSEKKRMVKFYWGILKNFDSDVRKRVRIIKDFNTSKILFFSNIVVTVFSTVAMEAIISNKPLILINFDREHIELFPFKEAGGALTAYEEEEFMKYIKMMVSNSELDEKLRKGRAITASRYFLKNDGLASKRVVDLIKSALK